MARLRNSRCCLSKGQRLRRWEMKEASRAPLSVMSPFKIKRCHYVSYPWHKLQGLRPCLSCSWRSGNFPKAQKQFLKLEFCQMQLTQESGGKTLLTALMLDPRSCIGEMVKAEGLGQIYLGYSLLSCKKDKALRVPGMIWFGERKHHC